MLDELELKLLVRLLEELLDWLDGLVEDQDDQEDGLLLELLDDWLELELLDDSELRLELLVLVLDRLLVMLELDDDSSSIVRMANRSPVRGPGNCK